MDGDTTLHTLTAYRVGGSVRDALLGLNAPDRDWVVVGESPQGMLARGFRQVGAEFPVFLHPETGEEYALARRERKTGPGYHGFAVESGPGVTLEEDLSRRDLTINAMALDAAGGLVDPFGGGLDLQNRLLRHVSDAFGEDPLRVLRVARFQARFDALGFRVAPETLALMTGLVRSGELAHLAPERVWLETLKALSGDRPWRYFEMLDRCGALAVVFPELAALQGQSQPPLYHPEGDAWVHTRMVLEQAALLSDDPVVRFAALTHDLGKGATPPDMLPHHYGHEEAGAERVAALCDRLRVPTRFRDPALLTARHHTQCHRVLEMRPKRVVKLLRQLDALRKPERLEAILLACRADILGCGANDPASERYRAGAVLRQCLVACRTIDHRPLLAAGFQGRRFGEELHQLRIQRVKAVLLQARDAA